MDIKERMTLESVREPTLIACEHLHRYELAGELLASARTLDLCCGSGYGSAILAEAGGSVHGVDNDAGTIDIAQATVGRETGATFEAADALAVLRRDLAGQFDAIVCFEGLEHLPDVEAALTELRRHAAAGVRLVLSVPNSRAFEEVNDFHASNFGWDEAREAFGAFENAIQLRQVLAEGSLIQGEADGTLDARLVGLERAEPEWANHYLVAVNFEEREALAAVHRARMQLQIAPVYNRYMKGLEEANHELRRRNEELARGYIGRSDSAAASYVSSAEQRIQHLEAELAEARLAPGQAAAHRFRARWAHRARRLRRLVRRG